MYVSLRLNCADAPDCCRCEQTLGRSSGVQAKRRRYPSCIACLRDRGRDAHCSLRNAIPTRRTEPRNIRAVAECGRSASRGLCAGGGADLVGLEAKQRYTRECVQVWRMSRASDRDERNCRVRACRWWWWWLLFGCTAVVAASLQGRGQLDCTEFVSRCCARQISTAKVPHYAAAR